jgi:hypothetical protein
MQVIFNSSTKLKSLKSTFLDYRYVTQNVTQKRNKKHKDRRIQMIKPSHMMNKITER